jgi:signal transduction histidine kinase
VLGLDVDITTAGPIPIRFGVRNSGIGIPVAQRSRIFQHFTEAASSTTP